MNIVSDKGPSVSSVMIEMDYRRIQFGGIFCLGMIHLLASKHVTRHDSLQSAFCRASQDWQHIARQLLELDEDWDASAAVHRMAFADLGDGGSKPGLAACTSGTS